MARQILRKVRGANRHSGGKGLPGQTRGPGEPEPERSGGEQLESERPSGSGPEVRAERAEIQTLSPWKSSETLRSSKTAARASATIGAIERTVRLSKCFSLGTGRLLVTMTSRIGPFFSRSMAGPESSPWVARIDTEAAPRLISSSAALT